MITKIRGRDVTSDVHIVSSAIIKPTHITLWASSIHGITNSIILIIRDHEDFRVILCSLKSWWALMMFLGSGLVSKERHTIFTKVSITHLELLDLISTHHNLFTNISCRHTELIYLTLVKTVLPRCSQCLSVYTQMTKTLKHELKIFVFLFLDVCYTISTTQEQLKKPPDQNK